MSSSIASIVERAEREWNSNDTFRYALLALPLVILLVLPFGAGAFWTSMFIRIFVWSTLAIAFNFAFGFADLPSFGHAAFYAAGAYVFTMTLFYEIAGGLFVPVILALVATIVLGLIVGYFSLRGIGIYFALITFGFAEVLHQIVSKSQVTKGTDGMLLRVPDLPLGLALDLNLVYYMAVGLFVITFVALWWILKSPFGRVMAAIRENDDRAQYVGYPVDRVKLVVFVLSVLFTGAGGVIFVLANQFVGPSVAAVQVSIDLLIMAVIGGSGFLMGPAVGALFVLLIRHFTRDLQHIGVIIIGLFFIGIIMFMPSGIYGKARQLWADYTES